MKKYIFALIVAVIMTVPILQADEVDLVRGLPIDGTAASRYNATDGDDTTYHGIGIRGARATFTLDSPVTVTSFRLKIHGESIQGNVLFYNQSNVLVHNYTYRGHGEDKFTSLIVEDVKSIAITNTGTYGQAALYTFELYGATGPTSPPTNLKATTSSGKLNLSWDGAKGAAGYYVYIDGVKSSLINGTSHTANIVNDREYSIYVTSYNGYESMKSETIKAIHDSIPPSTPTLIGESLYEGGKVRLSWTRPPERDVDRYRIYQDGMQIEEITGNIATISAAAGVMHKYTVTAVDQSGNESGQSNVIEIAALEIKDTTPPRKPTGLKGKAEKGYTDLSWTPNEETDLAGYYVYVNGVQHGGMITDANIKIYGLPADKVYKFRVAAVDKSGNRSAMSDEVSIETLKPEDTKPPAAPKNLTAVLAGNYLSVFLSWGAVNESDVIGYYVYVSDDDLVFKQVNAQPIADTNYNYTEIEGNQTYYFKVAAVDSSGNVSERTKSVSIKVPTRDPKEDVSKKNELLVKWNEIKGAVNYLIYFNGVLIATTDNQTFSFVIGEQYGYTGQPPVNVEVKAKFEDGSYGYDKNLGTQSKWGFSVVDLWKTVQAIVIALSSFLLLGIVVRFAPRIFKLIKESVLKRRHSQ